MSAHRVHCAVFDPSPGACTCDAPTDYERGFASGKAAGRAEAAAEIESLRAECGLRQIAGYNKGKKDRESLLWLRENSNG